MTTMNDVDRMAEAIEHARFDELRQGRWAELRPAERSTRVRILRDAMLSSGVAAEIDALRAQAERTALLLDLLAQRDRDTAEVRARNEADAVRQASQVATLRSRVAELSRTPDAAAPAAAEHERLSEQVRREHVLH